MLVDCESLQFAYRECVAEFRESFVSLADERNVNRCRPSLFESNTEDEVASSVSRSLSPASPPLLQDHANLAVPPSKDDFVMTGNLQKRRGGFGKMSQNKWKNRCFVLLKTGNLCYFQVRQNPEPADRREPLVAGLDGEY